MQKQGVSSRTNAKEPGKFQPSIKKASLRKFVRKIVCGKKSLIPDYKTLAFAIIVNDNIYSSCLEKFEAFSVTDRSETFDIFELSIRKVSIFIAITACLCDSFLMKFLANC